MNKPGAGFHIDEVGRQQRDCRNHIPCHSTGGGTPFRPSSCPFNAAEQSSIGRSTPEARVGEAATAGPRPRSRRSPGAEALLSVRNLGNLDHRVIDAFTERDSSVAGNGPWCCRPDHYAGALHCRGSRSARRRKRTKIVVDVWSWYSTSASARAVFSTTDHITGLAPL